MKYLVRFDIRQFVLEFDCWNTETKVIKMKHSWKSWTRDIKAPSKTIFLEAKLADSRRWIQEDELEKGGKMAL